MSDYLPLYDDADAPFTLTLAATVVGGQLVTAAGLVAGTAATDVVGVAGQDGVAGQKITVWSVTKHVGTASGTIAVGQPLCAGPAGTVRAWVTGTDAVQSVTYSLFGV
jgi:hypothetical protein